MQFSKNTSSGSSKSLLIKIILVLIIFIGAIVLLGIKLNFHLQIKKLKKLFQMKNLKLLNKNYLLIILFSLFFGFAANSQEPVDIWKFSRKKKPKENTTLIEDEAEKNIPQNGIYEMQSQKEGELSIEEDTNFNYQKKLKLVRNL